MVVESDKADMDVEAFESGYLARIIVPEGSVAPVGVPPMPPQCRPSSADDLTQALPSP